MLVIIAVVMREQYSCAALRRNMEGAGERRALLEISSDYYSYAPLRESAARRDAITCLLVIAKMKYGDEPRVVFGIDDRYEGQQ